MVLLSHRSQCVVTLVFWGGEEAMTLCQACCLITVCLTFGVCDVSREEDEDPSVTVWSPCREGAKHCYNCCCCTSRL